ncbi:maleylpyruvate isomerase N-terminal domain-containing protein [Streptomyces sp. NPDC058195]|uniref:maleylpyruvate isomerase N-terminal domain-containing protein n=1 Tax=Streptomyces sp. NPDC058195 TaxID=3346375 RepID=UPI0036EFEE19
MAFAQECATLLRLFDERPVAFRAAADSAPSLDVPVPTCPGCTRADLVHHRAGYTATGQPRSPRGPPPRPRPSPPRPPPREHAALLASSAEPTRLLLHALRETGPDRGCWTWWGASQSPQTSGAVARHQLQEARRTPTTPSSPRAPRSRCRTSGTRRCGRVPAHLLRDDECLAPRARRRRLPHRRGPFLAPLAQRRRRTGHPPSRSRRGSAASRPSRPVARPVRWSSPCTAGFRWAPWRSTETSASSTGSRSGSRRTRKLRHMSAGNAAGVSRSLSGEPRLSRRGAGTSRPGHRARPARCWSGHGAR